MNIVISNSNINIPRWAESGCPTIFIYVLIDPRDGKVRYVGKSNNPKRRLTRHNCIAESKGLRRAKWIGELRSLGLTATMEVLEACSADNWKERERYWIQHYGGIEQLFNDTYGGENNPPRSVDSYHAQSLRRKGKPRPPE